MATNNLPSSTDYENDFFMEDFIPENKLLKFIIDIQDFKLLKSHLH